MTESFYAYDDHRWRAWLMLWNLVGHYRRIMS